MRVFRCVDPMDGDDLMTIDEVKQVVRLYNEGWGVINIARRLDANEKTVESILLGKRHASVTGGRIMHGKRPKEQLAIYRNTCGGSR